MNWLPTVRLFNSAMCGIDENDPDVDGWAIIMRWGRLHLELYFGCAPRRDDEA